MPRIGKCLALIVPLAMAPAVGCDSDGRKKTNEEQTFPSAEAVRAKLEAEGPDARFSLITVHQFGTTWTKCSADDPLALAASDIDWSLYPKLVSDTSRKLSIDAQMPVSELSMRRSAPRGAVHYVGAISKFGEVEFDEKGNVVRTKH